MGFNQAMRKVSEDFQKIMGLKETLRSSLRDIVLTPDEVQLINQECKDGIHCPTRTLAGAAAPHIHYHRYMPDPLPRAIPLTGAPALNLAYYSPIEIHETVTIDRLGVFHGSVAAGNYYEAIYDSTNESPVNRLALSASTLCNGVSRKQMVTITPATLQLTPGTYFIEINTDNNTDNYAVHPVSVQRPGALAHGPVWYQENLGGYVAPPATATPVVAADYNAYHHFLRVASTP